MSSISRCATHSVIGRLQLDPQSIIVFFQEVQTTVATLVERGVLAESEIVAMLQQILPEQLQQLIPEQLKNVAPQAPAVVQQQAQENLYEEPPLSAEQLTMSQTGLATSLTNYFGALTMCICMGTHVVVGLLSKPRCYAKCCCAALTAAQRGCVVRHVRLHSAQHAVTAR